MNFAYGVIIIVGILAAISIGFIAMDPNDIIEPRIVEEKPVACTLQWDPMCGVDGKTYGNSCMLDAANVKLNHSGECVVKEISINSSIMPSQATEGTILLIEAEFRDDDGNVVDHVNYDVFATQDGKTILSEPMSHRHPGKHPIHEITVLSESDVEVKVIVQGLGHGEDITGPKGVETMMIITPVLAPEEIPVHSGMAILPETLTVSIAEGSGVPGCDSTDSCYVPYSLDVRVGDTVSCSNDDSAAHTVTSGSVSGDAGVTFDSSLFMAGTTFDHTFDEAGTFDYFCMVHPWMTGKIIVNEVNDMMVSEPIIEEPIIEEPSSESPKMMMAIVSIPPGVAVPGCEKTNSCYSPYEVTISVGNTVTWSNDDSAAHTVTSGSVDAGLTGVFDSGLFASNSRFEHTFDTAGTFDYFCMVHPWTTGVVHVD